MRLIDTTTPSSKSPTKATVMSRKDAVRVIHELAQQLDKGGSGVTEYVLVNEEYQGLYHIGFVIAEDK